MRKTLLLLALLLVATTGHAVDRTAVDPAAAASAASPIPLSTSHGAAHISSRVTPVTAQGDAKVVTVSGGADESVPGWSIVTVPPAGWTSDCCQYARAIGVNQVFYQGDWTGNPDRVMVLNVWPRKLPSLKAERQADQTQYLKKDPKATVSPFPLSGTAMTCDGVLYQGTDHVDDVVVFCDPGKAAGIRLSWSMTVAANDPQRASVLALFRQVVQKSRYTKYRRGDKATSRTSPP